MDFKVKIILIFVLLFPLFVFAQTADYLFVFLRYDFLSQKISLLGIEQRVLDLSQVLITDAGDFELSLVGKNNKVVGRNTFTVSEEIQGHLKDGTPFSTKTDSWSTTVVLPLNQSFIIEDLSFQVKKDGQVIFSEKFPADTFTVLDAAQNTITEPEPLPPKERKYLPWLIGGLIIFAVWFVWRWRTVRKRLQEQSTME